ncbi:MAG: hypothetical protein DRI84_08215, partial [Bacteroidetes bacterium]
INISHKSNHSNKANVITKQPFNGYSKTASIQTRWYNYATSMNNNNGNIGSLNWAYLFPDSLVYARYGSSYYKTWVHAAAVVLDPTDNVFQYSGSLNINKNMPYRLDSIGIYGKYVRHLASSIVDTLIVEFLAESNSNMPNYYFTGSSVQSSYGVDTAFFKGLYQTNSLLNDNSKIIVKIPLTAAIAADTLASGLNYFKVGLSIPISVSAGKVIAMTYQFKPGYTYGLSDTLNNMNYFEFLTYEENGDNTYPSYSKMFFNQSFVVQSNLGSNWSSLFAPTLAFVKAYQYESHLVDFKLSTGHSNPSFRLIISEIMYNDLSDSDSLEYFELFYSNNFTINLGGCTITKGVSFTFPPNTYLYDGHYLVVAKDSALINSVFGISGTFQWDSGELKNSGEEILIRNAYGDTFAYVNYKDTSPWPITGGGYGPSIEFCNTNWHFNNDGASWEASNDFVTLFNGDSIFGTPGKGCVISSIESQNNTAKNISMYPNPVDNVLYFGNIHSSYEVSVFDISGSLVKHFDINDSSNSVNLEELNTGLYFIQFVDKKTRNRMVKKLLVH